MSFRTIIDRTSYVPLYAQVLDSLRAGIENGHVKPGEQLPSEGELCTMFDVSRTVIRQALSALEKDGLIVKERGRGSFVSRPKLPQTWFQHLLGFHRDLSEQGYSPRSQVLNRELVPVPAKIAQRLNLSPGEKVIFIRRLRFVGDEPIQLVTSYMPYRLFPRLLEADLETQSVLGFLEREYGIEMARGHRSFEAVAARPAEAELLRVPVGAPMLLLESVTYLADGTAFEYFKALHSGNRTRFEIEVSRTPISGVDGTGE